MAYLINLFRPFCMVFVRFYLKHTKGCNVSIFALLNRNTVLEGFNKIGKKSCISNSKIGYSSIVSDYCNMWNCHIGRYCSIAGKANIVSALHPAHTFVSSHPAFYSINKQSGYSYVDKTIFEEHQYYDKENGVNVKIGNDVWIGYDVTIMGGLEIGDGAIIATGAVVTKNVRPYSIVGGVPAKEIKRRFTDSQVDFLLNFKWWDKSTEWMKENASLFQDIDLFISKLKVEK